MYEIMKFLHEQATEGAGAGGAGAGAGDAGVGQAGESGESGQAGTEPNTQTQAKTETQTQAKTETQTQTQAKTEAQTQTQTSSQSNQQNQETNTSQGAKEQGTKVEVPNDGVLTQAEFNSAFDYCEKKGLDGKETQEVMSGIHEQQREAKQNFMESVKQGKKDIEADPVIGGTPEKIAETEMNVDKALNAYASEDLKKWVNDVGARSNKEFVNFLNKIGKEVKDDSVTSGNSANKTDSLSDSQALAYRYKNTAKQREGQKAQSH